LKDAPASHQPRAYLAEQWRLDLYRKASPTNELHAQDLADADAVFDRCGKVGCRPWCPAEVGRRPGNARIRAFSLSHRKRRRHFGNSFVEWAASEAFRRAVHFPGAQFGVRSKPKPFTGVAVFDNPDRSTLFQLSMI